MHTSATTTTPPTAPVGRSAAWPAALLADVLLVLLFAAVGRNAHSLGAAGVLETAWPFLTGLLLGWGMWRLHRAPFSVWPRGIALWLTTVAIGMVLRVLVGEGTAPSFVVVALAALAVLLLGPRALAQLLRTVRPHRSA